MRISVRNCNAYKMSAAMLTAIRSAESLTESRARCAQRAVVTTRRWPRSRPMIGRPSPSASAREAKAARRSWIRRSSSPARARIAPPGVLEVGQVSAYFLAGYVTRECHLDGEGLAGCKQRRERAAPSCAAILESRRRSSVESRSTSSQRSVWISLRRQPVRMSSRVWISAPDGVLPRRRRPYADG